MLNNYYTGFYSGISADKRLDKRMAKVIIDLIHSGSATINKTVKDHASKTATYRILDNKRVDYNTVLNGSFRKCAENIDVEHVLCLQDTTEFNLGHIANKIGQADPDVGPTTRKDIAGFFCHPMLVCDPSGENIYGLASTAIYNRTWGQKNKHERGYQSIPIEEKESYRWIENALNTRARIAQQVRLTIIGDRESDIYDEFVEVA
ncbi:MAG: transposase DNA-binding-containing protein, partial [Cryomorphaceae bacterium]